MLEILEKGIKANPYIIVIIYILFTISIICNLIAVISANKDTKTR